MESSAFKSRSTRNSKTSTANADSTSSKAALSTMITGRGMATRSDKTSTKPDLHLKTLFVLNRGGRILSTREPGGNRGPLFTLIRSAASCVWAVRADVPEDIGSEIDDLAREEPPVSEFRDAPIHAERYLSLRRRSHSGQGG